MECGQMFFISRTFRNDLPGPQHNPNHLHNALSYLHIWAFPHSADIKGAATFHLPSLGGTFLLLTDDIVGFRADMLPYGEDSMEEGRGSAMFWIEQAQAVWAAEQGGSV